MTSRQKIMATAKTLGIEIEVEQGGGYSHVHAYAPEGLAFAGSGCNSAALWDALGATPIDWKKVAQDFAAEIPMSPAPSCIECGSQMQDGEEHRECSNPFCESRSQ